MAHPYDSSREDKVGKSRAKSFVKGYATGGAVPAYKAGGAIKVPAKASGGEVKVQGRSTGGRLDKFARGGKVKKPETQINIAVVQPPGDSPSSSGAPAGAGLLPPPSGSPLPPPPPAAGPPPPMMAPPPGPPPGMKPPGMMKRGGTVAMSFKRGGKVTGQKGGGDTGVGRLDKVKMQKAVKK